MKVDVHLYHHASAEDRERGRYMAKSIAIIRETLDMISPKIQDALDRIRNTQSLVASVKQASDVQNGQIATLTTKVADLQAKIDAGSPISADDMAGLAEITSDIDLVNAQLQSAIPANTGQGQAIGGQIGGAVPPQSDAGQPAAASAPDDPNAPPPPDAATQTLDAGVAAKPQPLAGTGAQ